MTRRFVLRPKTFGLRSTAALFGAASIALIYRATERLAIAKSDLAPAQYADLVALVKERFNARAGA